MFNECIKELSYYLPLYAQLQLSRAIFAYPQPQRAKRKNKKEEYKRVQQQKRKKEHKLKKKEKGELKTKFIIIFDQTSVAL